MSRPQPCSCVTGDRNRPSVGRGPKPMSAMRQPQIRMIRGVRQPSERTGSVMCLCRARAQPRDRLLDDRQVDERGEHAEVHRKPPYEIVGAVDLEGEAAEIDAEEAADLMAEEHEAVEHREPF